MLYRTIYITPFFSACSLLLNTPNALAQTDAAVTNPVKTLPPSLTVKKPHLKLGFGSCLNQNNDLNVLNQLKTESFDAFVFMGDNVYADTLDPAQMTQTYEKLQKSASFVQFVSSTLSAATWDDHDYGNNDEGVNYPHKEFSQNTFLNFWNEPQDSKRRAQKGIYTAHWINYHNPRRPRAAPKKIQLLLLDTRYHRSDLTPAPELGPSRYRPDTHPDKTILGATQWAWLEKQLKMPADIRLLVSSIDVIPDEHPFEKWANLPLERERLINALSKASGKKLILSGDRHLTEYSCLTSELCEWTLSGLNMSSGARMPEYLNQPPPPNQYRKQLDRAHHHYGVMNINFNTLSVELITKSDQGEKLYQLELP